MLRTFEEYVQSVVSFLCVSCVTYIIFDQRPTSFLLLTITSHFWSKMYLIWDFLFVFYIIQYYHWICWLPTISITLNKYCLNKKVFSKFKKRYFPQKQTKIEYWLRGLFLASSLINSSCLPNTRHYSKYEKIIYKSALEQYFTVGENWRKIYLWNLPSFATKIVANFFWM